MTKISESEITRLIRLRAGSEGVTLWRNNVGACYAKDGRFIRYGLANESKIINDVFKSSDLIGIKEVLITSEMVGTKIGQFVAIEVKASDWEFVGSTREVAQKKFLDFIRDKGGLAGFMSKVDAIHAEAGLKPVGEG